MAEHVRRYDELTSLGYGLAAISVDPPERSRALEGQLGLPFPLLCDPSRAAVEAFDLLNEKEHGGIAYPATFVLDRDRTVRFRSLDRTASRVDLDALFAFLHGSRGSVPVLAPATPPCKRVVPTLRDWARITKNAIRYGVRSPKA